MEGGEGDGGWEDNISMFIFIKIFLVVIEIVTYLISSTILLHIG